MSRLFRLTGTCFEGSLANLTDTKCCGESCKSRTDCFTESPERQRCLK